MRRRLAVGGVLGEAWTLYTRNSGRLIAAAALVFALLALVGLLAEALVGARLVLVPLALLVTIVGVFWLQGALVLLVADLRAGRVGPPLPELFARVRPALPTLVLAGLVVAVLVAGGLVLLIVPGLVVLTFLSMVTPVVVLERAGVRAALARSARLVRGNALPVFAVVLLTVVFSTIFAVVVRTLLSPLPAVFDEYLAGIVANGVTVPFVALAWTVAYFDLREFRPEDDGA